MATRVVLKRTSETEIPSARGKSCRGREIGFSINNGPRNRIFSRVYGGKLIDRVFPNQILKPRHKTRLPFDPFPHGRVPPYCSQDSAIRARTQSRQDQPVGKLGRGPRCGLPRRNVWCFPLEASKRRWRLWEDPWVGWGCFEGHPATLRYDAEPRLLTALSSRHWKI